MYRIIGADDKEYGPVSAEQIRQWVREGRLNRLTRVKPENASEWKVIGALPEFNDLFPPLPGAPPIPTGPTKTCGLATGALICGALGFTGVGALAGLVMGLLAHSQIRQSRGRLTGSGLATAGIVLSAIFLLLFLLAIPAALLLPALSQAKGRAQGIQCMNNVKQLELALLMYANDNTNAMPAAKTWCDDITPYLGPSPPFQCPSGDVSQRGHYAFNAKLVGKTITDPARTVSVFETDQGWNASGGPELMIKSPRHGNGYVFGFADGHVEMVT